MLFWLVCVMPSCRPREPPEVVVVFTSIVILVILRLSSWIAPAPSRWRSAPPSLHESLQLLSWNDSPAACVWALAFCCTRRLRFAKTSFRWTELPTQLVSELVMLSRAKSSRRCLECFALDAGHCKCRYVEASWQVYG